MIVCAFNSCHAVLQDATGKECGLHSGNVVKSAAEQAKDEQRDLWQEGVVEALSKEQLQGMMDGKRDKDTMLVMYAPWCQYSQVIVRQYLSCAPLLMHHIWCMIYMTRNHGGVPALVLVSSLQCYACASEGYHVSCLRALTPVLSDAITVVP